MSVPLPRARATRRHHRRDGIIRPVCCDIVMRRAYVRDTVYGAGSRSIVPVGWLCDRCDRFRREVA